MPLESTLTLFTDYLLFGVCLFILMGSIFISYQTRFVQIRFIPSLFKMLKQSLFSRQQSEGDHTILPHKALFTAMSTTLGISTIVAPVIAISLGGPGALLGFLLTGFFGSAATYAEVNLCLQYRKKRADGVILGGPMQYLKELISPAMAKWYALCGCLLMAAWSSAQANQLAAILNSPLLAEYRVSPFISGAFIAGFVMFALMGGVKRVSELSSKLVPTMFVLYVGSCLWIISANFHQFWDIGALILRSAVSPYALATGSVVGGIVTSLRWGVFKGIQTCEAGLGTQAIPHSMAETQDPTSQATLAMLSTYTAGIVAFLSGCVALMTQTWLDSSLPLGISMVAASFHQYFSFMGVAIIVISTILFASGTILGNSFNGSQCFYYLSHHKKNALYLIGTGCMIFLGAISDTKIIWSMVDIVLACLAIPHMTALVLYVYQNADFAPSQKRDTEGEEEFPIMGELQKSES